MIKKFKKAMLLTTLCGTMLFGGTITAYAGGGEETDEPMTEAVFTPVIEQQEATEMEQAAFTPDGNAELVDEATDEDAKLFYTFVTKNGNYFYLIIDKAREQNNVYMLNMIDEQDLMALIDEQEDGNTTQSTSTGSAVSLKPEAGVTDTEDATETETVEKEVVQTQAKTNSGASLLIVLLVLGGGAAGAFYYFKFVKGKKDNFSLEDDLDFYDDEDYQNEDDAEETEESENATADVTDDAEDETGEIEEDI